MAKPKQTQDPTACVCVHSMMNRMYRIPIRSRVETAGPNAHPDNRFRQRAILLVPGPNIDVNAQQWLLAKRDRKVQRRIERGELIEGGVELNKMSRSEALMTIRRAASAKTLELMGLQAAGTNVLVKAVNRQKERVQYKPYNRSDESRRP
jgi:hypothetical protein